MLCGEMQVVNRLKQDYVHQIILEYGVRLLIAMV